MGHTYQPSHRAAKLGGVTLGLAILTACPSYTMMQSPQNLEAGETRIAVAPSLIGGIAVADVNTGAALPSGEISFRHGITDAVEFGAKVYPLGLYTDFKFQLLADDAPVDLALAPGWSLRGFSLGLNADELSGLGGGLVFNPQVPLLLGVPVGERHRFVVSPRLGLIMGLGGSTQGGLAGGVGVTGGLGLGWHFAWTPNFAIMPEISFNRNLVNTEGAAALGAAFEAGLGFHFGGRLQP